jgi:plastocyanin
MLSIRMNSSHLRAAALVPGAALLLALGGCDIKHPSDNVVRGKQLFVAKCGACHTLAHAGTTGTVGPNLDDSFAADREVGIKSRAFRGMIDFQIRYPNPQGGMPAMLYDGQDAGDVAGYVALVAGLGGHDTGALATAVASVKQSAATEQNGTVEIDADPTGQLKFLASSATATAGSVMLRMANKSSVPHDIAITGNGVSQVGQIVSNGGTSTVTAHLAPGTYTFYCSVPGHEAAGMKGTLTVK